MKRFYFLKQIKREIKKKMNKTRYDPIRNGYYTQFQFVSYHKDYILWDIQDPDKIGERSLILNLLYMYRDKLPEKNKKIMKDRYIASFL